MNAKLNRRDFLKGAAVVGAMAAVGPFVKKSHAAVKPDSITVLNEDFEPLTSWVNKQYEKKYGIKVEMVTTEFTGCYQKEVSDMISGSKNSLYDCVMWSDPFTGAFGPKGYYEPLDGYFAQSKTLPLDEVKGAWVPAATYDRKIYGVPFHNLDMQLFYRTDLIQTAPRTYDQILEWAKLVNDPPRIYGYTGDWDDDNFWYNFRRRLFAAGGRMWDDDGMPRFNDKYGERALEWFVKMWDAGVVFPETLTTYSGGKNNKVFAAGKAAISFNWSWANITFEDPKAAVVKGKYNMAINPRDPQDPEKKYSCSAPISEGLSIPAKSAKKEWAWKYIEEYISTEAQLYCVNNLGLTPVRHDVRDNPDTKKWPIFDLDWHQMEYFPNDEVNSLSPYGVDFVVIRSFSENFHKAIQGQVSVKKALDDAAAVVARAVEKEIRKRK